MTEKPIWHFPEVGQCADHRFPNVIDHLRRSGFRPETKPSDLFPHHVSIFVAARAKAKAIDLLTQRYSRF